MAELDEKLKNFEERMATKKVAEKEEEKVRVEKLSTDYLRRTGRTEMKP